MAVLHQVESHWPASFGKHVWENLSRRVAGAIPETCIVRAETDMRMRRLKIMLQRWTDLSNTSSPFRSNPDSTFFDLESSTKA